MLCSCHLCVRGGFGVMIPQGDFINLFSSEVFVFVVLRIVVDKKSTVVCTAPSPKRPYIFLFADFFDLSDPKSSFFLDLKENIPSVPRALTEPLPLCWHCVALCGAAWCWHRWLTHPHWDHKDCSYQKDRDNEPTCCQQIQCKCSKVPVSPEAWRSTQHMPLLLL